MARRLEWNVFLSVIAILLKLGQPIAAGLDPIEIVVSCIGASVP
jgi:hypothetical protein